MTAPVTYNPFEYHRDPYPLYRRLRDEAPLCHNADVGCWTLSRFADVQAAARDWQRFSSAEGNDLDDTYLLWNPGSPESQDPPDHARLRDVVRRHFSPRTIAELELTIRRELAMLLQSYRNPAGQTSPRSWRSRCRSPSSASFSAFPRPTGRRLQRCFRPCSSGRREPPACPRRRGRLALG